MPKNNKGGGGKAKPKGKEEENDSNKNEKVKAANHVKCRHILCEKMSKAEEAYSKLEAGESFSSVAEKFSEDKARQGGLLGWQARGQMVGAFQDRAFSAPIGKYTEIFKTQFGYHILLVEERKA